LCQKLPFSGLALLAVPNGPRQAHESDIITVVSTCSALANSCRTICSMQAARALAFPNQLREPFVRRNYRTAATGSA
jgi:hypothetical protein